MAEEERTHTEVASLSELQSRQHPLPWVLFGVATLLLALVGGMLARRLTTEVRRANTESERSAALESQLKAAQADLETATKRATDAEASAKASDEAEKELADRVKKLEGNGDGAAKPAAAEPPPKKGKPPKGKPKHKKHPS